MLLHGEDNRQQQGCLNLLREAYSACKDRSVPGRERPRSRCLAALVHVTLTTVVVFLGRGRREHIPGRVLVSPSINRLLPGGHPTHRTSGGGYGRVVTCSHRLRTWYHVPFDFLGVCRRVVASFAAASTVDPVYDRPRSLSGPLLAALARPHSRE